MNYIYSLPYEVGQAVSIDGIEEIRIRKNQPIKVMKKSQWYYVEEGALTKNTCNPICCQEKTCQQILDRACNNSVFAYEQQLSQGFFTFADGVRVGVSAKMSFVEGKHCISEIFGLCFRIPSVCRGVSKEIFDKVGVSNLLVLGKVNTGKTTFLRDYATECGKGVSTLVCDERGEINVGNCFFGDLNVDVISFASKAYSFEVGTRALSPEVIVCDELNYNDFEGVKIAQSRGVKVSASIHGDNVDKVFALCNKFDLEFDYLVKIDRFSAKSLELYKFDTKQKII